ncbi:TonB-dependent receptor domain-containing protein [Sediminibacter sp. Hel_I_10]|uniref:TonB-dependent receptor n=1 Tax=Sediminibacter sp. Hel_I_10 TaxID=1392490 RepID=UPI0004795ECB|nr:TonB-dependent receptor [Sediminibacter sp. Hel_I_10]
MKYFLCCLALIHFGSGFAQDCTYTFEGQLIDFHDNSPIAAAAIYIESTQKYVTSDFDGNFTINNLCEGPLILKISHIACEDKTTTYTINSDRKETIYMEHHTEELNEISVISNGSRDVTKTAQETVLESETLNRYSALNLGDALKEVSGVSSINTGNAIVKPMINGMHSSRLLILNNGVRLQDQEWGIEHAPNIDINTADQISVIKGSAALAYGGDAIGGVVVIKPSRIILKDSLYGSSVINGQSNGRNYSISSNLHKTYASGWFATVQGSYKQNGDYKAPDYSLTNTGLKSKGLSFRLGKKQFESGFEVYYSYLNNEIGILKSSHIGSVADLVTAINSGKPYTIEDFSYDINSPKQDVTHHLVKASYYKRFKNFGKVNLQYDYQNNQRFEFDIRRGENKDKPALDLKLQTHTLQADAILDASSYFKHHFGVMARYQDNFANPGTGVRRLIPDYNKYDLGAFFTTEWRTTDRLTLDAGIRYDFNRIDAKKFYRTSRWIERGYDQLFPEFVIEELETQLLTNPVLDYHNVSASAGAKYQWNDNSTVLGNYSLSSRSPNVSELFSDGLHHSAARIELGNLSLQQEFSNRFSVTYNYTKTNFKLNLEAYYNHISDFIYLEPTGVEQTIRGAFPVWDYKKTNAQFYGIDVYAGYSLSDNWGIQDKTSFIKANDLKNNRPIIDIPAFNTINELTYKNANWNNFSATLKSEWVFEQTNFPNNNFEVFVTETQETVLLNVSSPPPAFHLFHFYSDVNFKISEATQLNVALSVNNILNTNYRSYLNRLRYFADDLGRNVALQLRLNY